MNKRGKCDANFFIFLLRILGYFINIFVYKLQVASGALFSQKNLNQKYM